jgi:methylmalonyl-CoA mutase
MKGAVYWGPWSVCISVIKYRKKVCFMNTRNTQGELPLIGVNTFLNKNGSPTVLPNEVIRSTKEEKEAQIQNVQLFWKRNAEKSTEMLNRLKGVAVANGNLFEELMETVKYCSLGRITHALYEVGGQYRRSM